MKLGTDFEVGLAEIRTAGYHWTVIQNGEPACELLGGESDRPNSMGGSGTHRWKFRAIAEGTGLIELEYSRSWEKTGPTKRFQLTVIVRP